jgi:predicted amidohydrolase YtcJ
VCLLQVSHAAGDQARNVTRLIIVDYREEWTMKLTAVTSIAVNRAQSDGRSVGADLIVFNAHITTQDAAQPEASAVAVKRGKVYAVGSDADILDLKDNNTRLIDAHGRRLIPGLNDAHVHVLNERSYNYNVRWDGVPTLQRALEMLAEQATRTPEGQWVKVIGGWSPHQFKENRLPTMEELRKAVPDRPLIVQYAYNQAFLNELAITALGIGTARFPMLPGTDLETDKQGHYTGIMHGNTFQFVSMEAKVPQPSLEEQLSSFTYVINDLNRFGITSVVDGGSISGYPQGHTPLQVLARANRLNVRFSFIDVQFGDVNSTLG